MRIRILLVVIVGLTAGWLLANSAKCVGCEDGRLCRSVDQCGPACQCIPMPGRTVGQCQ